jgi:hypothetical protein
MVVEFLVSVVGKEFEVPLSLATHTDRIDIREFEEKPLHTTSARGKRAFGTGHPSYFAPIIGTNRACIIFF